MRQVRVSVVEPHPFPRGARLCALGVMSFCKVILELVDAIREVPQEDYALNLFRVNGKCSGD